MHCSYARRFNIVNMSVLSILTSKSQSKYQQSFFVGIDKMILKSLWKYKEFEKEKYWQNNTT